MDPRNPYILVTYPVQMNGPYIRTQLMQGCTLWTKPSRAEGLGFRVQGLGFRV